MLNETDKEIKILLKGVSFKKNAIKIDIRIFCFKQGLKIYD